MSDERPPSWAQVPELTRRDFQAVRLGQLGHCDQQWYESLLPEHRISALNAYAGLKSAGLWNHVEEVRQPTASTSRDEVGKFDFIARDADGLRDELRRRPDFADPGGSRFGWYARDDSLAASMHLGQYGHNPAYINVHFDKSGLGWHPATWLPHLFLDAIPHLFNMSGSGYKDVRTVRDLLRDKGLDPNQPVLGPAQVGDFPATRVAGWASPGTGVDQLASFTWRASEAPRSRFGRHTPLPTIHISASPSSVSVPPPWRLGTGQQRYATLPASPRAYDFTVRELPGNIRALPGRRIEFPGMQVTARPRANLLQELGSHMQQTQPPPSRHFDWTARPAPMHTPGAGNAEVLPGLRLTATPRPNLLRELGERLREPPARYRFSVRQEPGALRLLPGGGIEFPPIHMVATPVNHGYLSAVAAGLR